MAEVDFSAVFQVSPVACALLSPDQVYIAVNRAYERLARRSGDQLIGREVFQVFPGGPSGRGARELRASLERVARENEVDVIALQRYDIEVPERPGELQERYWTIVNAPLPEPGGGVALIIHRVEEVTEFIQKLRQVEGRKADRDVAEVTREALVAGVQAVEAELFVRARELQQVNERLWRARVREREATVAAREALRRQQQAVADTSHDLRGPLTGLQTRLEAALTDPGAGSRQVLHAALHDAERLGDIVADLLELARLEADAPLETEPVDLADLVESEVARRSPGVPMTSRMEAGVIVDASAVRLDRLLSNLLDNAERHTRTRVEVSVRRDGDQAVLEVVDDGPGIPAAERQNVFRRFYRRPDARRSDPEGTGLGLAIARQIAQAHHGSLHIADETPGTRVVLHLPIHHTGGANG